MISQWFLPVLSALTQRFRGKVVGALIIGSPGPSAEANLAKGGKIGGVVELLLGVSTLPPIPPGSLT